MFRAHLLVGFVVCVTACGPTSRTVTPDGAPSAEREILDAEHGWVSALLKGDFDAFADSMADDFIEIGMSGLISKAAMMEAVRSGSSRYEELEIHDIRVRFPRSDVAVVTAAYTEKALSHGKRNDQTGVYVNTWIRFGSRWQVVSTGTARTSPPAMP